MAGSLEVHIVPLDGTNDMDLERQVQWLRRELLELPVEAVIPITESARTAGAKSTGTVVVGALSVTGIAPVVIHAVVDVCKSWMARNKARRIRLVARNGTTVELDAFSARTERDLAGLVERLLVSDTDSDV